MGWLEVVRRLLVLRLVGKASHPRWPSKQDIQPCKTPSSAALITCPILPFGTVVTVPPTSQLLPLKSVSVEFHALVPQNAVQRNATQRNEAHRRSCFYQQMRVGGLETISGHFFWSIWSWPPKKRRAACPISSLKMERLINFPSDRRLAQRTVFFFSDV